MLGSVLCYAMLCYATHQVLFNQSLEKSARSDDLAERIKSLNEYHTFFVYRMTCRALFECHKLLFSFQAWHSIA